MRFKIEIELKNEKLPLDYRPTIISLFKHSLTVYENGKYFNTYYEKGKDKPFTFAVGIRGSQFTKEMILVTKRKLDITFSTSDIGTGIVFFNALLIQKDKPFRLAYENTMIIKNITIQKEVSITTNSINVLFLAPLCVRDHCKEKNKDTYFSFEKPGFNEALKKVLKYQIEKSNTLPISILDDFSMKPIECKKTVVRHHSQFIEATIGSFNMTGNIALLNYFYSSGVASRKSSGFGLIEIIGKEEQ